MLQFLTHSVWADRIGWLLVHSLWQFTLVALAGDRPAAGLAALLGRHPVRGIAYRHDHHGRHAAGDMVLALACRFARGGGQARTGRDPRKYSSASAHGRPGADGGHALAVSRGTCGEVANGARSFAASTDRSGLDRSALRVVDGEGPRATLVAPDRAGLACRRPRRRHAAIVELAHRAPAAEGRRFARRRLGAGRAGANGREIEARPGGRGLAIGAGADAGRAGLFSPAGLAARMRGDGPAGRRNWNRSWPTSWPTSAATIIWSTCSRRWWRRSFSIIRRCGGSRGRSATSGRTAATTWRWASPAVAPTTAAPCWPSRSCGPRRPRSPWPPAADRSWPGFGGSPAASRRRAWSGEAAFWASSWSRWQSPSPQHGERHWRRKSRDRRR